MELVLLTIFGTSFVIALSGALMPGPLLTVTISESTTKGAIAGPLMILGHGILELVLILALLSGLGPLLSRDDVFIFISLAGGSVLLWMGYSMIRSIPTMSLGDQENSDKSKTVTKKSSLVLAGITLSAINPYWIIWWASIGLGYITHSLQYGLLGIIAFFTGHILADLAWYAFVSMGIAKGKHLLSNSTYRGLLGGCAVFLLVFSLWFFYSGVVKIVESVA